MQRFASSLFAGRVFVVPPGESQLRQVHAVVLRGNRNPAKASRRSPAGEIATRQLKKKYIIVRVSPSFNWDVTVTFGHDVVHNYISHAILCHPPTTVHELIVKPRAVAMHSSPALSSFLRLKPFPGSQLCNVLLLPLVHDPIVKTRVAAMHAACALSSLLLTRH